MSEDQYNDKYREYPPVYTGTSGGPDGMPPNRGYDSPPVTPLPFREALRQLPRQYIKAITRPSAATFAEEMNKASWGMLWVQLLGIALFSLLISLLLIPVYPLLLQRFLQLIAMPQGATPLPPTGLKQFQSSLTNSISSSIASVPTSFFIGQGIYYLLAKAFRGTGTFLAQGYTTLLFQTPLALIGSILTGLALLVSALVPSGLFIGIACIVLFGLALGIYQIVLQIFTIMATHRLSGGKATAVVLLPYAAFVVLYLILVFAGIFLVFFIFSLRPH